jgi:uncharacterized protein (DUF305 family)
MLVTVDPRPSLLHCVVAASRGVNHTPKEAIVRHTLRFVVAPVAASALLLSACGSDSSSNSAESSSTQATEVSGDFNDADVLFAQGMIPHHEQAVEMAALALDPAAGAGAEIQALATEIQAAQDPEIDLMTQWLQGWGQPMDMPGMEGMDDMAGMEGMDGMMSAEDMDNLATLSGAEFDTAWVEMMIAHHEGAIAQAQTVQAAGSNPDVLLLAEQIIAAQQAEIDQMKALLAG